MINNSKANKPKSKVIKILLIIISPIILLALIIIIGSIVSLVYDKFNHDKFITLDSQMRLLYAEVNQASNGSDAWKYSAVCSPNRSGWMATGDYNCITSISIQKTVSSVDEVSALHDKYFPVIDKSAILMQSAALDTELPDDFGKKFVVSSAEKKYKEVKTGIECSYLMMIGQSEEFENEKTNNSDYGSGIEGSSGRMLLSLRCDETARDHWYKLIVNTSSLIP